MLIYEPTIYQNLDCNLYDNAVDYHTGEIIGPIKEINDYVILVDDLCYWPSGLSKEAPCLVESEYVRFDTTGICDMKYSILWYYSLKDNHRIKC
jgi:hypothetical protein